MKSRVALAGTTVAMIAMVVLFGTQSFADKDEPVKLFKKYGCMECHSLVALDLHVEKSEEADAEAKGEDELEAPDLSAVGKTRDPKWISNYLRKKEDIDGRKHEKRFKGTDEERRAIAIWLASMKHDVPEDSKKTDE